MGLRINASSGAIGANEPVIRTADDLSHAIQRLLRGLDGDAVRERIRLEPSSTRALAADLPQASR